jgi:hypothetical protein
VGKEKAEGSMGFRPFSMGLMADHRVFQSELFLLQTRQQIFVGVGSVLFRVDLGVKSGMLGCDRLDVSFVHRSISFRWLTRDRNVNKSRNEAFVATVPHGSANRPRGWPMTAAARDGDAGFL